MLIIFFHVWGERGEHHLPIEYVHKVVFTLREKGNYGYSGNYSGNLYCVLLASQAILLSALRSLKEGSATEHEQKLAFEMMQLPHDLKKDKIVYDKFLIEEQMYTILNNNEGKKVSIRRAAYMVSEMYGCNPESLRVHWYHNREAIENNFETYRRKWYSNFEWFFDCN